MEIESGGEDAHEVANKGRGGAGEVSARPPALPLPLRQILDGLVASVAFNPLLMRHDSCISNGNGLHQPTLKIHVARGGTALFPRVTATLHGLAAGGIITGGPGQCPHCAADTGDEKALVDLVMDQDGEFASVWELRGAAVDARYTMHALLRHLTARGFMSSTTHLSALVTPSASQTLEAALALHAACGMQPCAADERLPEGVRASARRFTHADACAVGATVHDILSSF